MSSCGGHRAGSKQIPVVIQPPQNTNTSSTMKRHLLRREFMRNLTYGVNRSASHFTTNKDRMPSSYFISRKSLTCKCQRPPHHRLLISIYYLHSKMSI